LTRLKLVIKESSREQVGWNELANQQLITAHHNVLISGHTSVGKSFIACALGNATAWIGYTVLYVRLPAV